MSKIKSGLHQYGAERFCRLIFLPQSEKKCGTKRVKIPQSTTSLSQTYARRILRLQWHAFIHCSNCMSATTKLLLVSSFDDFCYHCQDKHDIIVNFMCFRLITHFAQLYTYCNYTIALPVSPVVNRRLTLVSSRALCLYFTPPTRTRQNCLLLSCPCRRCEHNWRQDKNKTVLSCLDPVSSLQLFSLK